MTAETLRCPGCGAPASSDEPACTHCGARLATIACPSCFGMMFLGSRHCPHCGQRAEREDSADAEPLPCPRCGQTLHAARVGGLQVRDCPGCGGVWLEAEAFHAVTADREAQAAVLAFAPPVAERAQPEAAVRYAPCPCCGAMMNRVNFARISGVVVDTCRAHGTWFDREELRRIVEFIRAGGLEASRERERRQLEEERRRLEAVREGGPAFDLEAGGAPRSGGDETIRGLLRFLGLGL